MDNVKKIRVRFNGSRFPRTVSLRGGKKISFHRDRLVLVLDEYDALLLLRSNTRLTPDRWEFTIDVTEDDRKEKLPGGWTDKESEASPAATPAAPMLGGSGTGKSYERKAKKATKTK